jgi:hypothetical protein
VSDKPIIQADVIDRNGPFIQDSFDLDRLDNFVTSLGVEYIHYKGMPSPIGKNDRGDFRRNDGVDTITSNGMIYIASGKFTATMTDNTRNRKTGESSILDPSESRLVLPRFYNKNGIADGDRIYLLPGDRIYVADKNVDVEVSNTHEMDYEPGVDNVPMFHIAKLELPIVDSRNIYYKECVDFIITQNGDIRWLPEGKNPGIDPNTGKGRVYTVRYRYKAYWYIGSLIKELRVTNITDENGVRSPERMSYHTVAVREYVFHSQNKGSQSNQLKSSTPDRADKAPIQSIKPNKNDILVDMSGIGEENE